MVSKPSSTHYTEVVEVALETTFQGLEIANATYVKKRKIIPKFQPSRASMMVAKVMLENGYHYGGGLGRNAQGLSQLLDLTKNKDRFHLGYKPSKEDKMRIEHEKKRKLVSEVGE